MKPEDEIFKEAQAVLRDAHPDSRERPVLLAWCASTALTNAGLGTLEDAIALWRSCKAAIDRQAHLYDNRDELMTVPSIEHAATLFEGPGSVAVLMSRARIDDVIRSGGDPSQHGFVPLPQTERQKADVEGRGMLSAGLCVRCGAQSPDASTELLKCGACRLVQYYSPACQQQDWPTHKPMCKAEGKRRAAYKAHAAAQQPSSSKGSDTSESAAAGATTATAADAGSMQPPSGKPMAVTDRCELLECRLAEDVAKYGKHLAEWWHDMTTAERREVLSRVTGGGLPEHILGSEERRQLSLSNQGAAVLVEYNYEQRLGECGCRTNDTHHYPHRLLHEIYFRGTNAVVAAQTDCDVVSTMLERGAIPYDRPTLEFEIQGKVYQISDTAPPETVARTKEFIEQGVAVDCCARRYAEARRQQALLVLVAVFDVFCETARRAPPDLPLGRITGCTECLRSAAGPGAIQCHVCKQSWWCCAFCRQKSAHGRKCPVGAECEAGVSFGSSLPG